MELTIEIMEQLNKYYFDDAKLSEIDLDELKRKHPYFQKRYISEKIDIKKENQTILYKGRLNEEYQYFILSKDTHDRYGYAPDNEVNEYFDFSDRNFNPQGNPETHEIYIPDFTLIFDRPFMYNYYFILLQKMDKQKKNGVKKRKKLNISKTFIPDYISENSALIFDENSRAPLSISFCVCDSLDHLNNEISRYHGEGTLFLYVAKKTEEDLGNRGYYSDRLVGKPQKSIEWFQPISEIKASFLPSEDDVLPYIRFIPLNKLEEKNSRGVSELFRECLNSKKKFFFGDADEKTVFISHNPNNDSSIRIKLFTEHDYYALLMWLLCVNRYKNTYMSSENVREYWPSYLDHTERLLESIDETLKNARTVENNSEGAGGLAYVYSHYPEAFDSRKKLEAYLADCIRDRGHRNMILSAYDEGIYSDLLDGSLDKSFVKSKFCKVLVSNYGMAMFKAEEVVNEWIEALG